MMRLGVLLIAALSMTLITALAAKAEECEARVFHESNVVQGKRVYIHWRVGHTPWRWATVSFRYQLTYVDENNKEGKVDGRFRQLISGGDEEYIELKNLRRRPVQITRTKISEISCQK